MTLRQPSVIGITCVEIEPPKADRPPRVGLSQSYTRAVSRAGAAPLLIPHITDEPRIRAIYDRLDGLLLSGGGDIDPAHYGERIHPKCRTIDARRDEMELMLSHWAIAEGKPILAICRGIQVLNVAQGGSLYQDIEAQIPSAERHDWSSGYPRNHRAHTVAIEPGTHLATIAETSDMPVNSFHHQALKSIAPGFIVSGRAPDGIVEAIEAENHPFAVAVQWHPEELAETDPRAQHLFDALVEACRH
jgi:putative glutamine amidotransferase